MRRVIGYIEATSLYECSEYLAKNPELTPMNIESKTDNKNFNDRYILWFWEWMPNETGK